MGLLGPALVRSPLAPLLPGQVRGGRAARGGPGRGPRPGPRGRCGRRAEAGARGGARGVGRGGAGVLVT